MPTVNIADAIRHLCPFNDFKACRGSVCMAWVWDGPAFERCETDNLVETEDGTRPVGAPPTPEGSHWEADGTPFAKGYHQSKKNGLPSATAQRWVRQRERALGFCSRCGHDTDYHNF